MEIKLLGVVLGALISSGISVMYNKLDLTKYFSKRFASLIDSILYILSSVCMLLIIAHFIFDVSILKYVACVLMASEVLSVLSILIYVGIKKLSYKLRHLGKHK